MKFQLCLGALLVASTLVIAHGKPTIKQRSKLSDKQKENIVSVIQLTPNEDDLKNANRRAMLFDVVIEGIEKVAMSILEQTGKEAKEAGGDEKDNKGTEKSITEKSVKTFAADADVKLDEKADSKETDPKKTNSKETDPKKIDEKETDSKETDPKKIDKKETDPKETDPKETDPKKTDPKETDPKKTDPKEADPKETDPKEADPKETDPKKTDPKETDPKEADPKETDPKETDPKETDPKETDPKETDPKETDPKETDPKETDPKEDVTPTGGLKTTLVVDDKNDLEKYDFSKPIEFFVENNNELMAAADFVERADGLKTEIEKLAEAQKLDLKVAVVDQGLPAWAIILIVIAVLLLVGAGGYVLFSFVGKRQGNSF